MVSKCCLCASPVPRDCGLECQLHNGINSRSESNAVNSGWREASRGTVMQQTQHVS